MKNESEGCLVFHVYTMGWYGLVILYSLPILYTCYTAANGHVISLLFGALCDFV